MMSKMFLIVLFRSLSLFKRYLKTNMYTVIALSGLFLMLHSGFSVGSGVSKFTDGVTRLDKIRVYPDNKFNTNKDVIDLINSSLGSLSGISKVEFITSAQAKKIIEQNTSSIRNLELLSEDMFPSYFELKVLKELQSVEALEDLSQRILSISGVETVSYGQEWATQMEKGRQGVYAILSITVILFILISAILIYQMVSVTLYKYMNEIRVYSLVGGTMFFITLPFIVISTMIGILSVFISLASYMLLHALQLTKIESLIGLSFSLPMSYAIWFFIIAVTVATISGTISAVHFFKRSSSGS